MAKLEIGKNDLQTYCIENNLKYLLKEWHPTKNGDLKPTDVTAGCNKKVWWLLPYDDPKTGKHFDFEWEDTISHRTNGRNCPYVFGNKLWKGYNDLATINPKLAKEWHPTKNGLLTPEDVTFKSNNEVWWLLPYDDPKTGKHFDFEWKTRICHRVNGVGCPYLSGSAVWKGFNDLATTHPHSLTQWHPTKNGDLKPTDVTAGCGIKVWWLLPYDDPNTDKHFDFEWETTIYHWAEGNEGNCPYLVGKKICIGFNDLNTLNPELAKEWHPIKNGDLKPTDITISSNKNVWWLGKCGHEWVSSISNRKDCGCPICAKELKTSFPEQAIFYYIKKYFKDAENGNRSIINGKELDIYIPTINVAIEYDGKQWHQDNKKDEAKNKLCKENKIVLYRIRERECWFWEETKYLKLIPCTSGNINELENAIKYLLIQLNVLNFDVDINRDRSKIYSQYINRQKGNSLAIQYPEIASQWHPTKNGKLTPYMVSCGSNKKVWWLLPYDDPNTGKHFDFEWETKVVNRINGRECPFLSGKAVWLGFNDLATTHLQLASEWHPTKNGDLKPTDVTAGSGIKVWWFLPYDDPITGKHFDFEWETSVLSRKNGNGCPFIAGQTVWKGFNDLATTHPQLASEWHPTKNWDLKPTDVTAGSGIKVWWFLPYDDPITGKHFDFEWETAIYSRVDGRKCPYLSGRSVWKGFNDLQTVNPKLAKHWHPIKNGDLTPYDVTVNSNKKVWWINENGEESYLSISYMMRKNPTT